LIPGEKTMYKKSVMLCLIFSILFMFCSTELFQDSVYENGMVSTAHPIATQAGIDILKAGGNAFDAAVAIAAVLNVVEPNNSGIGGYGTILVYDTEKKETRFLDSSGKIPISVNSDVFRAPTPNYRENRRGPKAVSTPGNVNAWNALSKEYGKLEWKELFASAINTAENGFKIHTNLAGLLGDVFTTFPEHAKKIYGKNGSPLKKGELLVQKDLAASYRIIAEEGYEAVYGGKIGVMIDKSMSEKGGFLSLQDLISDKAEWWEPISIDYRGYNVYTASPPSTAFPSLIRLGLMSRFNNEALGHNSTEYLHMFAEVTKHAFWCRLAYAGDPDYNPPPLDKLLSEKYWKEIADSISPDKVKPFTPPGKTGNTGINTTHFVVADKWGNIVSATQTLGNSFGSRIMVEGTGIWLNNSLAYCTFEPKGNPMDAHAGHRKLSGDCPTIIFKNGRPVIALGTPGGHTIGQTVPQMVMNLIDFKMDIQQAVSAPRISFQEPDRIMMEPKIPEKIRDQLEALGHNVQLRNAIGNAHGLSIEYDSYGKPVQFMGGSDPRGAGLAKGY
jgi:gamma-glutamyltranspeptidase/glutathione hydrolase